MNFLNSSIKTSIQNTLLITLLPGIGGRRYWSMIDALGSAEKVLQTPAEKIPLLSHAATSLLTNYQQQGSSSQLVLRAEQIISLVSQQQGEIIGIDDEDYPPLLKNIDCPPPLLYLKGNRDNLSLPQLAVVGSRHASHSGINNTQRFSAHLSSSGFIITSGLALGIDGSAHESALEAQGKTIGVMATGIDQVYPKRHWHLADKIIDQGGTLVSEFPPLTPPKANHFPRRNRIISGLSLGVLVVEASLKSGSLITAHYAAEQGREVFAIPGSIHSPHSKGCHQLLKNGATLVETSSDIVVHLQGMLGHCYTQAEASSLSNKADKTTQLLPQEHLVLEHIGYEIMAINQLIASTQLSHQQLMEALMSLEIKSCIKRSEHGYERV